MAKSTTTTTTTADAQHATETAAVAKTSKPTATLKAEYDAVCRELQAAVKSSTLLEVELQKKVKEEIKAKAGDIDKIRERKTAAYTALLAAEAADKIELERAALADQSAKIKNELPKAKSIQKLA